MIAFSDPIRAYLHLTKLAKFAGKYPGLRYFSLDHKWLKTAPYDVRKAENER